MVYTKHYHFLIVVVQSKCKRFVLYENAFAAWKTQNCSKGIRRAVPTGVQVSNKMQLL